ncbi:MAG: glucose-6-phosphate isomerase [Patescibacteria group bacterium]
MIEINSENIFAINKKHGLSKSEFCAKSKFIKQYLQKIHAKKQDFYKTIDDNKTIISIKNFAKKNKGKFKDIVILGIGGSALGAICIQQSLKHLFGKTATATPKLHILDNIDPTLLTELEEVIDYKKTLFIVITKSGTTPETITQYLYFRSKINTKKLDPKKHFIFITDPKTGILRQLANKEKIPSFDVPTNVGGRFSVLTAVGLLPAALININTDNLIVGARKMRDKFFSTNFSQNLPFQLATVQYLLGKKGKNINVLMPYSQKLIKFADWYRQLLAESIGKERDNKGKIVNMGLTPINALGVTDQHSQLQLFNEGPNDKLVIFIEVKNLGPKLQIPNKNLTFNKLLQIEKTATETSLTKNNRPNITITVDKVDEQTLGGLFMLFECGIAFLGEFFNINAFDQPGVEFSKKLTKDILKKLY